MRPGLLAAAAAAAAVAVVLHGGGGGQERYEDDEDDEKTIFVSIASYRDSDCAATVRDAFAKAKNPERVFVGLCEQNSGDADEVCAPSAGFEHHDRVRRVQIPAREAKGPTYARALSAGLFRDEDYFMQIDSHSRFQKHWDALAIADLRRCDAPKPLLTHYPPQTKFYGKDAGGTRDVPVLCKSSFNESGILSFEAVVQGKPPRVPPKTPFVAGGFVFARGAVVREVPFDPSLDHLFMGEEILWSARAWTSGWDFFAPTRNVVYHHYNRPNEPKFWELDDVQPAMKKAEAKVRQILAGRADEQYRYGLGTQRSVRDYWEFIGADPESRTSASADKWCPK